MSGIPNTRKKIPSTIPKINPIVSIAAPLPHRKITELPIRATKPITVLLVAAIHIAIFIIVRI